MAAPPGVRADSPDYSYTISNGQATITGYTGAGGNITIPSTLGGCPVVSIGDNAFNGYNNLTSVIIPDNVTSIGDGAFYSCNDLASITLPENLTSIGDSAFGWCNSLTSITIPDSVTSIGDSAFYSCNALTSITLPDNLTIISNDTFNWCNSLTSITIPDGVTSIGDGAFYSCNDLASITLPENLTSIGDYSFYWCNSLTGITIPDSVTSIGNSAFQSCSSLASITLPENLTSIGDSAFGGCSSLTNITFLELTPPNIGSGWIDNTNTSLLGYAYYGSGFPAPGNTFNGLTMGDYIPEYYYTINNGQATVTGYYGLDGNITIPSTLGGCPVVAIGSEAFYNITSLTSVVIPGSVTSIGDYAFVYCSSLVNITIPDSVTSIGNYAFDYCSALTNITIPDSVTSIGDFGTFSYCSSLASITLSDNLTSIGSYTFNGCSSLASIIIPDGVTNLGDGTFQLCTSLASVTLPENLTSIGDSAFYNCYSLANISIPDGVTSIGDSAFGGCSSLTSITIPDGVTSVGDWTFGSCSSLASVTLPENLTSIGFYAFSGCSSLANITIPDSVTSIGDYAFYSCSALTNITLPDNITSISYGTFQSCSSLTGITLPDSLTSIGNYSFSWCTSLASITIPDSVTSIGNYSFYGCFDLTNVAIPDSVTSIGNSAFQSCSSLASITLPENLTSIGDSAFGGCSSLTNITFLGLAPPSTGNNWIVNSDTSLLGYAYYGSGFPAPGNYFDGLLMGDYIPIPVNVTFSASGVDSSASGTILTVDGVNYNVTDLPTTFTWESGSSHSFAWSTTVNDGSGVQYAWQSAIGLSSSASDTIITPYSNGSVSAAYIEQYYITVTSAHGSPTQASQWVNESSDFTVSVTDPDVVTSGQDEWIVTGLSLNGTSQTLADSVSLTNVQAPYTIAWSWTEQYYLNVTSAYGAASGSGWYNSGSTAYAMLANGTVAGATGVQYVFAGWFGDASGTGLTSDAITMSGPMTANANWNTQYYLAVQNGGYGTASGSGWYDAGTTAAFSVNSTVAGTTGTQYAFTAWSGNSTSTNANASLTMSGPMTVTANWETQYLVTFAATGNVLTVTVPANEWVDSGSTAVSQFPTQVVNEAGDTRCNYVSDDRTTVTAPVTVTATYQTQYYLTMSANFGTTNTSSGWYDAGTVIGISATAPSIGSGEQYIWNGWTGIGTANYTGSDSAATVTMNSPVSEDASWTHQFQVTFTQTGLDSSANSAVVNTNSSASFVDVSLTNMPYSEWVNASNSVEFSYYATVNCSNTGERFAFASVNATSPFTVTGPMTISAVYGIQYYLNIAAIDGTVSPSGWYNSGSQINIYAYAPGSNSAYERCMFNGWTGSGTGSYTGANNATVTMSAPISEAASWTNQYYIIVSSGHGSPTQASQWVNAGDNFEVSVTDPYVVTSGQDKFIVAGLTVDGSIQTTADSVTFADVQAPHNVTWSWTEQYYITVTSAYGTPSQGSEWVNAGSSFTTSVTSPASGGSQYVCTGYEVDGGTLTTGTNCTLADVQAPHGIQFEWAVQSPTAASLSISPSSTSVVENSPLTLTGTLSPARSGNVIIYQSINGSSFSTLDTVALSNGSYSYQLDPQAPGTYQFYAFWSGDGQTTSANSTTITVSVTTQPATTITTTLTLDSSSMNVTPGQSVTLSGTISPAVNGTVTLLVSINGSDYQQIATPSITNGNYSYKYAIQGSGTYNFQASYAGNDQFSPSQSSVVEISSVQPSAAPQSANNTLYIFGAVIFIIAVLVLVFFLLVRKR